jgi:hypothetical protein
VRNTATKTRLLASAESALLKLAQKNGPIQHIQATSQEGARTNHEKDASKMEAHG